MAKAKKKVVDPVEVLVDELMLGLNDAVREAIIAAYDEGHCNGFDEGLAEGKNG